MADDGPILKPLPPYAVGDERARWVQRIRNALPKAGNNLDYGWLLHLQGRLNRQGQLAVISEAERARVERIEKGFER